jgi:hypothetical protein
MIEASKSATLDASGLPSRDEQEIAAMFAAMPRQWVKYPGRSPALMLELRGLSRDLYCRIARKHLTGASADPADAATLACKLDNIVDAYMLGWKGATFVDGTPVPYSTAVLAAMMLEDPHLSVFVCQEARRLSPARPESAIS